MKKILAVVAGLMLVCGTVYGGVNEMSYEVLSNPDDRSGGAGTSVYFDPLQYNVLEEYAYGDMDLTQVEYPFALKEDGIDIPWSTEGQNPGWLLMYGTTPVLWGGTGQPPQQMFYPDRTYTMSYYTRDVVPPSSPTIDDLIDIIGELNLPDGIETSLLAKLDSALASLKRGIDNAAANQLEAFINQVEAQSGKKLMVEEVDALIATAQEIIDDITGAGEPPGGSCGDAIEDVDGNTYNTVQIGDQCWMAENLNVGTRIAGTSNQTNNSTIEKHCYNNDEAYCTSDGGLYQWNEAMQYTTTEGTQGICPDGWHIPTDAEWCTLENEIDSRHVSCNATGWRGTDCGTNLKSGGSSGFEALLAGYRTTYGSFYNRGAVTYFWSSTQYGASRAWTRYLQSGRSTVHRGYSTYKANGLSVRCPKD